MTYKFLVPFIISLVFIPCCNNDQIKIKKACLKQCNKISSVISKCMAFCVGSNDFADCSYQFCSTIVGKDKCTSCCLEKAEKKLHDIKSCIDGKYVDPNITVDEIWVAHRKHIEVEIEKWVVDKEKSPMDDSISITLSKIANEYIKEVDGTEHRPRIFINCKDNETQVSIHTGMTIVTGYGKKLLTVDLRLRFDKEKAIEAKMYTLRREPFLRTRNNSEAIDIIKKMIKHETMLLEFSPSESPPIICIFNTSRLSEEIKPLREACGW